MTEAAEELSRDDDDVEVPKLRPPEQHAAGDLDVPEDVQLLEGAPSDGGRGIAVVVAKFNGELTSRLLTAALDELDRVGVDAVLVGETLMRAPDVEAAIRELTGVL